MSAAAQPEQPGKRGRAPQGSGSWEAAAARSSLARCHRKEIPVDLLREGANMLELKLRQSRCLTPLSLSSKATRALLRQF